MEMVNLVIIVITIFKIMTIIIFISIMIKVIKVIIISDHSTDVVCPGWWTRLQIIKGELGGASISISIANFI